MADYLAREHERQVEAARAAQAIPNAQPNELDPYHGARTRKAYTPVSYTHLDVYKRQQPCIVTTV